MSNPKSALAALIALIKEEGPYILASPEDATYFRNAFRKQEPAPIQKPVEVILPPPPQKPQVIVAPPPPPPPPAEIEPKQELIRPVVHFSSIRNLLSVVAPELAIIDEIPNDEIAKKLSNRWKTKNQTAPLSVLVYQEPPEQKALLEQIAQALSNYFGPTKIIQAEEIEKEKQWEAFLSVEGLKMVITCDYTLWQLRGLMQFYKETPAQGKRLLGNTPLFLLPDLSLYLKDSLLKRSLWKALCQKCS